MWLDEQVEATLAESVPLVGAPAAWDAGYDGAGVTVAVLDTGIDADHPDLAGRVALAENFTDSETAADLQGHGTHVAGILAGSGAASGGSFTGTAPGATLLNGKVLGEDGSGTVSGVIAGMEWAAQQGADVVNLSLAPQALSTCSAAVAEQHGAVVLHYDADFEQIAATTGQPHAWVAPRGSVD